MKAPSLQLPKGGGAIRGMGEKFAANPVTGTGSMSVPIATSPGRSGFGPQLSLSYNSGTGNGPFGFGWSCALQSISRKTDKGLPQYLDAVDSDVFMLSGAEDLVPVLVQDANGKWLPQTLQPRTVDGKIYQIRRYRPRIEGLFARIERWINTEDTADVFWRSISRDNVTTWYGRTSESRIADPSDPRRIFSWLICQSHDDKGNVIVYGYKAEDSANVFDDPASDSLSKAHERNRTDQSRSAQRYLKRVRYGNASPYFPTLNADTVWPDPPDAGAPDGSDAWNFEVVFDYGEHDARAPTPTDGDTWSARPDPFSSYRAGFEVRTYRICRRVLMFHHFPDEPGVGRNCLVRATDFTYSDEVDPNDARNPLYTFLQAVTSTGYRRNDKGYDERSLPALGFEYSQPVVQDTVEEVDPQSLENLPAGLDGSTFRWTDLHGEGVPGILTEQVGSGAWFYKRNLGPLSNTPEFAPLETVSLKPNVSLSSGVQFMDLAGDGLPDLVVMEGPVQGLYEHDDAEGWQPFRPFTAGLNHDLRDPNLKFVDLDGDGQADVLITEHEAFVWHASLTEDGFGPARRVAQAFDEEKGPRAVFADGTQSIYLADLSGDGLTDIVRIRNGEVCYWPNLGYGRFGTKITMDNAPWFDYPEQFDPRYIRLADIDGSGTTDIIYLHHTGVRLYFNQSGNGWSQPQALKAFPRIDEEVSVLPTDLLGNGTACLVWSSALPGDTQRSMRYVNLMGGQKPHLLVKTYNNLGAETHVEYAPSTKFYLQDKHDAKPWITRLPFPVHVVERVTTHDLVSRNRLVTRYAYHHGYFDGEEREFRGFGMVEQWDTEALGALLDDNAAADNLAPAAHVPPVYTKTWFHTGIYLGRNTISDCFAGLPSANAPGEYFREPGLTDAAAQALLLPDTLLPADLPREHEREACRALKGAMLRQEIYADDAAADATADQHLRARTPYSITEQNFTLRALQPRSGNRHAVFFTHPRETISYHYERNPVDPRIQHALTLEVDAFGNVLKQAAIGYGRRPRIPVIDGQGHVQLRPNPGFEGLHPTDQARQTTALLTYTENRFTHAIETLDVHRAPLPCEAVSFELTDYPATGPAGRYQATDFVEPDAGAAGHLRHRFSGPEVAYEANASGSGSGSGSQRRRIEWLRILYRHDDLGSLLPLGELHPLALPGESYKLALTPGLLAEVYRRPCQEQPAASLLPDPAAVLSHQGGYLQSQVLKADGRFPASDPDNHWWIPSGRSFYGTDPDDDATTELMQARRHFFLPRRYRDAFGQHAFVDFDSHDLLLAQTRDALGNRVTVVANDYRVLQPRLVSDPNGNRAEVAFDTLGMVAGTAVMGKPRPAAVEGDTLEGFASDPTQAQLDEFFEAVDPRAAAAVLLNGATTRILYDVDRFRRTRQANPHDAAAWQPACCATLTRETHVSAALPPQGLRIQLSVAYSDGFGREIQNKIQVEPGPGPQRDTDGKIIVDADGLPDGNDISPRWVGSGWTVFNNKGKPVRQYEPFFTDTSRFEFDVRIGVSPVIFYDPAGRVVATLHPNHTFEKVLFNPWQQTTYDVNDTCAPRGAQTGDPRSDPDIGGYVAGYFETQPDTWSTWHAQRVSGALGSAERNAALRAQAHADTPTIAHFDTLGRPFLTVTCNRVACPGHDLDDTQDTFATRVELDIEGNQRAVRDAIQQAGDPFGRVVMRYVYDMLGNRIHQLSMDAGARWMLNDVTGKPIRAWDSRGHDFTTTYDALRRPQAQTVRGNTPDSDPRTLDRDIVLDRIEYGESLVDAQALNLRTRVYRHFDSAGVVTNGRLDANGNPSEAYDFKGNLLHSTRQLASDYTALPDWQADPRLDAEYFEGSTRYDALNRAIQSIAPHSSLARAQCNVIQPVYNQANQLQRLDVWLERATVPVALLNPDDDVPSPVGVANIDYNAKGQRLRIDYKNGASTLHSYDPMTFRLKHLLTRRVAADFPDDDPQPPITGWPGRQVQSLRYVYDPAGNITHVQDDAQQTVYFRNKRVEPDNDYIYDALYRLIQATGREHLGQGGAPIPHSHNDAGRVGLLSADANGRFAPNDGNAMGTYIERYVYDAVGNFLQMQHRGNDAAHAGWTRAYDYLEPSLTETDGDSVSPKTSNRLSHTTAGSTGNGAQAQMYRHDAHGNMIRMPHLGGGLSAANMHWNCKDQLCQVDLGGGGKAFHVYDASGQRVRKVCEKAPGRIEERIYLGGFEIFREHAGSIGAGSASLERTTLHMMDSKQRIALVETRTLDRTGDDPAPRQLIRYQFGNHLGSASLELDEHAQIISYEEYTPFGSTAYQAVRSRTDTPKRYRFTAKERDEETGLGYHGARYYAAWLGRWTAADPAGLVDGTNLFAYVGNQPLRSTDPSGTHCDPTTATCIDPTTPTAREELLQQSLPEDERDLPPASFAEETPSEPVASGSGSGSRAQETSTALSLFSFVVQRSFAPVSPTGAALGETLNLYSGPTARAAAELAPGYMIKDTIYYGPADAAESALRARLGLGPTDMIPPNEYNPIWDEASRLAVRDAAISGSVRTHNDLSTLNPNSIQARVELPTLRRYGTAVGGVNLVGGALSIYGGTQEEDSFLAALGIGGGTVQATGGALFIAGAWRTSSSLMSVGRGMGTAGAIITAPIVLSHAADDIQSGDEYRQFRGTLSAVGVVAPPAAFLSVYNDVFVQPAAETFYEVARRDIAQMLGVPLHWVY
ncbi:SpvB/TcaC N-terminal domain-containing protein [Pseudomonas citri]|uniref:SpvB/TcaC N-terminal domain-containing protein n=1 Tax=Pseudomonas citri TaxID=2978349 RepID=UPI0021B55C26|nr:SpvB/TcaC N-terminal domain-containing protein [Pseudomonas citri]